MGTKLGKSAYPAGSGPNDFECFGPPATQDGVFEAVKIADLGCFTQEGVDSNKYYHGAIVRHRTTQKLYVYFEWGRTGAKNPQFQFVECSGEADAQKEFAAQLHDKNDKRGQWINHPSLGRILQAKPGKDCYLVRPLATRSTGLPDARTIKVNEGSKAPATADKKKDDKKKSNGKKTPVADSQTLKLMHDLNVATVKFTRGAMTDESLPTQKSIDEARDIVAEALKRIAIIGDDIDDQVNDKDLKNYTSMLYGRIPKKKERGAPPETWILSKNNAALWQQDLDAFESALYVTDLGDEENDPFGGMKIKMEWLSPQTPQGEFLLNWMPKATANRHSYIGNMKIKNMWSVERYGDPLKLARAQERIIKDKPRVDDRPLHQPKARVDLDRDLSKNYLLSHTAMLFHGTRSVNVGGIMRENLKLPRQLVGVVITGAMFGPGLYFADDWKKSAGYTSLRGSYWSSGGGAISGRGAFMFVCDVALGRPYVPKGPGGWTKSPDKHHSVFGKAGHSQVQNNEFIIYEADQQQLRYLVEFDT